MTIPTKFRALLDSGNVKLAAWIPLLIAVAAFSGFLASSMIPPAPSADLVDLGSRVMEARSGSLPTERAEALGQAFATLDAARRSIEREGERPWHLRSYERARTLLFKAETLVELVEGSPPRVERNQTVPAG